MAMFEEDLHEGHLQTDAHLHASVVLEQPLIKQKKRVEIQFTQLDEIGTTPFKYSTVQPSVPVDKFHSKLTLSISDDNEIKVAHLDPLQLSQRNSFQLSQQSSKKSPQSSPKLSQNPLSNRSAYEKLEQNFIESEELRYKFKTVEPTYKLDTDPPSPTNDEFNQT